MLRSNVWLFTSLFSFGVIAGMGYLMINQQKTEVADSDIIERKSIPMLEESGDRNQELVDENLDDNRKVVEHTKNGDRLLHAGSYVAARDYYNKAIKLSGVPSTPIQLRLAISLEFTADYLQAEKLYERVAESAENPTHRMIAALGAARIWRKLDKSSDAKRKLADLYLHAVENSSESIELHSQVVYELASIYQDVALNGYHNDLSQLDGVAFIYEPPNTTLMIELLDSINQGELPQLEIPDPISAIPQGVHLVQRPGNSLDLVILSANVQPKSLQQLLIDLCGTGKFEIEISKSALTHLNSRAKSLHFRNIAMSVVLDSLLNPYELCWVQEENTIKVFKLDDLQDSETKRKTLIAVAERMFRQFSFSFPDNYRFNSAMLSRGNLQLLSGNIDSAINSYEVISQSTPRSELRGMLFFNQGKINMQLGRDSLAIELFDLAVHQTYDATIQSTAYWLTGQLFLEQNKLEEAIVAANRAVAIARQPRQKQLAALTLARAYLFNGDPASANQTVFENANAFNDSPLKAAVTILSTFSQFIGVEDENSLNVATERLVHVLSSTRNNQLTSFLDLYIAGRAYQELGFSIKAIEKFNVAKDATNLPIWKNKILFALAVELEKVGQAKDAANIYTFLIEADQTEWGVSAGLQLAELFLNNNMPKECINVCNNLIAQNPEQVEKAKLLSMMGYSFRKLNKHHASALCFAGIFPPLDEEETKFN